MQWSVTCVQILHCFLLSCIIAVNFSIQSWKTCEETSSERMSKALLEAMDDMKAVMEDKVIAVSAQ